MNENLRSPRAPGKAPFPLVVARKALWARTLSGVLPIILVNEYPKSGGTWLKNMLAAALDLPAWTRTEPAWGASVMQAHWLRPTGLRNVVALFRDGRDVMVSYYYHSFFLNEHFNAGYVERMRESFRFDDYDDIRANLLPFMREMLERPVSPGFTWPQFVETWSERRGAVITSYERLRADTGSELTRVIAALNRDPPPSERIEEIVEQFSMRAMKARQEKATSKSGQIAEKSFIRKGSVGGWSEHFTDEALDYFEAVAGHALDLAGYQRGRPGDRHDH